MDAFAFKKHTTSRGYAYNYYRKVAEGSKPTLVLLHGFPSSSYDWRHQIAFFQERGYGLIVPDMLGYAGSDKPTDPSAYVGSGLAKDVVDLLDVEDVAKAIVVGHDWGARVASRFVNFYPERTSAVGFITVGYVAPHSPPGFADVVKQMVGRDLFGYWGFFSLPGTDKILESHFDSFFSIFFPSPPSLWLEHVGPPGATQAWVEGDKRSPAPAYITEEDKEHYRKVLLEGGFAAPLCYYRVITSGLEAADTKKITKEAAEIHKPVFFAGSKQDAVCIPKLGGMSVAAAARGPVTTQEYDADHWVLLSHAEELNQGLLRWVEGLPNDA
ncbi:alpha/beta-hydrolase [Artomyces pyxidatus]|uniref:Alpha/beta-hydrolase n=1 Tax=Artomyces pyxidatus TaxID=48021 RepID=A0ACB8SWF7_9AGAM|nr:alpha/beta-hydrolase [Artomyces pyxidatus]